VPVLDFSAGRPVEDTPAYIARAAADALLAGDTHQTMAQGRPEYREACARKLRRDNQLVADPDTEIIATLGVKHGMLMALLAILEPGDEVLVEDPAFVSYEPVIRLCGAVARRVPLRAADGHRWTRGALAAAVGERTRAVLFCSPHNPVGTVHAPADLEVIADVARQADLTVVADETYERLTWGGRRHTSIATLPGMAGRTITLFGLTKAFAMGGWRVGFATAGAPVVAAMVTLQQHLNTCVGSFVQAGATVALGEPPRREVGEVWREWERRCEYAADALAAVDGLRCPRPEGGFYAWIGLPEGACSESVAQRLLAEHHVAVVPGASFGPAGEGHLRMTCVRPWDELREGVACIATALPELIR
jgi:aspartate/methionine/tyrosine aminotransferase